jgi:Uma2 family endonuclease
VLVEVLSASSSFIDLVDKVKAYKRIPTLQAYLIVKPDKVWVRLYEREGQGGWAERECENEKEVITLQDLSLPLQEVYSI